MKTIDSIPTGKIERVSQLLKTGMKVGGNYLKYYGEKIVHPDLTKDKLHEENAGDIYDGLKNLKGSALKVAQMLSMEKNLLPQSYVEKFSLSQFSVPPLSAPLVRKTFRQYFHQSPEDIFDTFGADSVNAASIGQVHKATKDGRQLAVKIQYPGIRESITTDIALVKPIAIRMFNLKGASDEYFREVEDKLREETDYELELQQSESVRVACRHLPHLRFPRYYPEMSCEKIITMDWMEGEHLSEYTKKENPQAWNDQVGQALWNFYMHQVHHLRKVHADPHPGNFLVDKEQNLIAIDFGCMKAIPDSFYIPYFDLALKENLDNPAIFTDRMYRLEILKPGDSPRELQYFTALFHQMLSVFVLPFGSDTFDFSDPDFFNRIAALSEQFSNDKELRKMDGNRGSKHFIYVNRTFFGLYSLLFDLKCRINVNEYRRFGQNGADVAAQ